jgi:hypothetical protein
MTSMTVCGWCPSSWQDVLPTCCVARARQVLTPLSSWSIVETTTPNHTTTLRKTQRPKKHTMYAGATTTAGPVDPNEAIDSEIWVLYACSSLFFLVALFCIFEFVRNHGCSCSSVGVSSKESTGWATRKIFHLLLFVANLSRGCALIVEILLHDSLTKRDTWIMSLAHAFPDLAFLSTYSFLVLFFAQSYYSSKSQTVANLNKYFFFANALVYLACVIIAIFTGPAGNEAPNSTRYSQFRLILEYILASLFGLSGFGVFYYGYNIIVELKRSGGVQYPEQRALMSRVRIVSFVCVTLFVCRAAYGFTFVGRGQGDMGYPSGWQKSRYLVDGVEYFLVELLPSIIILGVTRKRERVANSDQQTLLRTPGYEAFPAADVADFPPSNNHPYYGGVDNSRITEGV